MNEQECSVFWDNKVKEGVFQVIPDAKSKQAQLQYDQECGKYDKDLLYCIRANATIQGNISKLANQSLMYFNNEKDSGLSSVIANQKKIFADKGCVQILEKYRQAELGKTIGKFSSLDKARIEAGSVYERNQRIFFGALVLLGGVVIITLFSKKK